MAAAAGVISGAEELFSLPAEEILELVEANRQLSELASGFLDENAELRGQVAQLMAQVAQLLERDAEREELLAQLPVLQKIVFGRSSEKSRPEPGPGGEPEAGGGKPGAGKKQAKRGPGRGREGGITRTCPGPR